MTPIASTIDKSGETRSPGPGPTAVAGGAGQPPAPASGGLEALAGQAQQLQGQGGAAPQPGAPGAEAAPPAPAPAIPNNVILARLVGAVRDTVCMVAGLESPKRTITQERADKLGEIWGEVFDHYGIQLSNHAGKFGIIVMAAMASAEHLRDAVVEGRKEIAIKDGKVPAPPRAAIPAPTAPPAPLAASGGAAAAPPAPAANQAGYVDGQVKPAWGQS